MSTKATTPIDIIIGNRIRARRLALRMSQEKLGDSLGLTFQQIQKYEKGINRVTASRLVDIAAVLRAPIDTFFDQNRSETETAFLEDADLQQLLTFYSGLPEQAKDLVQRLCADLANLEEASLKTGHIRKARRVAR